MGRVWMVAGALAGAGAVGMAAVAAHALPGRLDAGALAAVQGAVQMQGWHALALVIAGVWLHQAGPPAHAPATLTCRLASLAGAGFALGMLLFCGAVYAHRLAGISLGPAAPVGGVLLMAAWLLLAASALVSGPRA